MNLDKQKILITGGAGFIGSQIAHYLDKNHPECDLLVVDIFRSEDFLSNGNLKSFGHFKNLLGFSGKILQGDITQKSCIKEIENFNPDIIFHQAAISDTTALEQDLMIRTNLNAYKDLLDICVKNGAKMIYASSAATYGDAPSPQSVFKCENPKNIYGFSKQMMDNLSLEYIKKFNTHIVGLRYFNVYGKGEFYKNKTASMVLQFAHQILKGNAPALFEKSDEIYRDFIYIKDVIKANLLSIDGVSGIYNVGTAKPRSFQDIADILQEKLGTNYGNKYIKNPYTAYQYFTQANMQSTYEKLGFEAEFSLEMGIEDYLPEIKRLFKEEIC